MNVLHPLRTPRTQLPRRRRLVAALIGLAAACGGLVDGAAAEAATPAEVSGDPHSPEVARLASVARQAMGQYDLEPTPETARAYEAALADVAATTARELGVDGPAMEQAWARTDRAHQTAVLAALTQLGVEYRSNTSEPFVGFDCSGLTSFAWREAGVQLSRQSGAQISEAEQRTEATAVAGDLVQYPGHVMMYLGVPDAVVHASNPERDVELWILGDRSVNFGDPSGLPVYVESADQA